MRTYVLTGLGIFLNVCLSLSLAAQTAYVPKEKIPQTLLDQVKLLESDFVLALQRDCADQGCYPRGCVYAAHEMVTMQGDQILPGLLTEGKPRTSGDPQYILTAVNCEYAFEEAINADEVQSLSKRLSAKLSNGVLRVTARGLAMPAGLISQQKPAKAMTRLDVWLQRLLDHFSWLLAFILVMLAALIGIWAWRRLGRDSKDDELRHLMLKAQLEAEAQAEVPEEKAKPEVIDPEQQVQQRLRSLLPLVQNQSEVLSELCLSWLETERFAELATVLALFAAHSPLVLKTRPEHLLLKTQFSRFASSFKPSLAAKQDILDELERELAIRVQLNDEKAQQLQRFFRYFSPTALANLLEKSNLEAQRGLLALAPALTAADIIAALPTKIVQSLTQSFWESDRVSLSGIQLWEHSSADLLGGQIPASFVAAAGGASLQVDAALILSFLLARLAPAERQGILTLTQRSWTRRAFFPELLESLPEGLARDILLSSDAPALAHWMASLNPVQQKMVWKLLPPSYQQQLRAESVEQLDASQVIAVIRNSGRAFSRLQSKGERDLEEQA